MTIRQTYKNILDVVKESTDLELETIIPHPHPTEESSRED